MYCKDCGLNLKAINNERKTTLTNERVNLITILLLGKKGEEAQKKACELVEKYGELKALKIAKNLKGGKE